MDLDLPPPLPALPLAIGKYRITGLIGEGSMGVVYRAQDPDIQRNVAVKTIRAPLRRHEGDGPTAMRQFRVEAQAAGRLNHPNIVAIYECGDFGGEPGGTAAEGADEMFIAMEHVEGPSLAALTRQGLRLALPDTLAVMLQLLDALQCAHAQRVWHCDIKPSNLLVAPDGRLKVTDFGIARVEASGLTVRNALWGSPGYMAPERYAGGAIDQRVDLFSCGVLLYELLTGCAPFVGSASAVMYQVLQLTPPPPSRLAGSSGTPALDPVVAKALAKHPGERFADAAEMRQALLQAVASTRAPRTLSREALLTLQGAAAVVPVSDVDEPSPTLPTTLTSIPMPASAVPPPARASSPAPTPVPVAPREPAPAGLPADALAEIEALLRPVLGAVTRAVVRDAARRCRSLGELAARIAQDALGPEERAGFLRSAGRLQAMVDEAQQAEPATVVQEPASRPEPVAAPALQPHTVDAAARLLARQAGPIAMLLARRAAAGCSTRAAFFERLAASAAQMVDADALRAELERLPD